MLKKLVPYRAYSVCLAALLALLLGTACSSPLVPEPRMPRESREELSDAAVIARLRSLWGELKKKTHTPEQYADLVAKYNADLLILIRRVRVDYSADWKKGRTHQAEGFTWTHEVDGPPLPLRELYSDVLPAVDVPIENLDERYSVPGLGIPLVGIIPADKVDKSDIKFNIRTRGTVRTLTAVLTFPEGKNAMPLMRLIPRHRAETIRVGRLDYQLAADFSAPIEVYWNLTRVKNDRFLGMLQPQELRDSMGLSCMEAYNPNKIPVILTHGLLSSAGTFDNMVNRLMADPEVRSRFQFWYYNYPTGVTWTLTAAQYRQSLRDVRQKLDPEMKNKNWDHMVVVGHSMGGLITRYSQSKEPWLLLKDNKVMKGKWNKYMDARYIDTPIPVKSLDAFREMFFFRPVQAGMVVYMATPHRGAPLARYRIVNALLRLVKLPENFVAEIVNIATLQQDSVLLNPERMTEWFTSVGQLSPESYSIVGLQKLQLRDVPTHSIIGDEGDNDTPDSSDGIVPYWSSHLPWGSEQIVPGSHSVQEIPETAEAFRTILRDYARSLK
ncbi:MAG: alpha/beta hydrolase [Akkermansia sp.]|nr:alpha/beta hydrolase [Akkermansia sp.]